MKVLDYLFFGIYNSYYNDGNFKNDIPWYGTMMIFGVLFFLNLMTLFLFLTMDFERGLSKRISLIFMGICILLSYLLFIRNRRYKVIYNKMSGLSRSQKRLNVIVSWIYVISSIALLFGVIPIEKEF